MVTYQSNFQEIEPHRRDVIYNYLIGTYNESKEREIYVQLNISGLKLPQAAGCAIKDLPKKDDRSHVDNTYKLY